MDLEKRALLIVDLQNDFVPGGSLPVKEGDKIVGLINQLLEIEFDAKVASKDWHPADHGSFAIVHGKNVGEKIDLNGLEQILWPEHCVQKTPGADFVPGLNTDKIDKVIYKGLDPNVDSYSAFFDNGKRNTTDLHDYLRGKKITDLYVVGLATDYCVKHTVLDALSLGYNVHVIKDACRGVNIKNEDSEQAFEEMRLAGAHLIDSKLLVF